MNYSEFIRAPLNKSITGLTLCALAGACTGEIAAGGGSGAGDTGDPQNATTTASTGTSFSPVGIDADGDGNIDGFDTNGDGMIDDIGQDTDGDGIVDEPIDDDPTEIPLGNDPDAIAQDCAEKLGVVDVGRTRLRRLTRDQFNNTVGALIGATGEPASSISADERIGPFHSNAITPIDSLMVEQHQEVAKRLAEEAQSKMAQIAPCELDSDADGSCARQFIEHFGLRAYRRPLAEEEVDNYVSLYQLGSQASGAQHGFRLVVEAMLQSPFFLYHVDVGVNGTPSATPVLATPHELAARLSYFLWNSMPDEQLFELAASGTLAEAATLTAQVDRLLAAPKAGHTIALFHRQWLGLEELPEREKDASVFPGYDAALALAMLQETASFADHVIRQGDSLLSTLFTADFSFPTGGLFDIYGVAQPAGFTPGMPVSLDGTQRAGILTQPAFLARHAHRDQTSPVHRGLVIRENLLCQMIEPPPATVNNTPPTPSPATSTRERFAQHSADPTCRNCHELMDPIGLGLENFDAVGAWRTDDGLGEVDATGSFNDVASDLEGDFDGPIELATKLAQSSQVQACVANQWFRFALGRTESKSDACSMQSIQDGFEQSGGNIRQLLAEIAQSEAFRHVRAMGSEEAGQ